MTYLDGGLVYEAPAALAAPMSGLRSVQALGTGQRPLRRSHDFCAPRGRQATAAHRH